MTLQDLAKRVTDAQGNVAHVVKANEDEILGALRAARQADVAADLRAALREWARASRDFLLEVQAYASGSRVDRSNIPIAPTDYRASGSREDRSNTPIAPTDHRASHA